MPLERLQCMRCLRRQGDVDRAHLFLCDDCAHLYEQNAFRGSIALYVSNVGDGRCEFCDRQSRLSYYQWLLCGYCVRVVQSYRMGQLSSHFVMEQLNRIVTPQVPHLIFEEADPIQIQSTGQRGRCRTLATHLDLHALERDSRNRAFWIELKTGPGSAEEMAEFQLDCSDCDDIVNTVRISGNAAFIFHVQMFKVPEPPTMRIVGNQIWWTDLFSFAGAFLQTHPRRGNERKIAAYFNPSCFRRIETFANFLVGPGMENMLIRLEREGCPALYQSES